VGTLLAYLLFALLAVKTTTRIIKPMPAVGPDSIPPGLLMLLVPLLLIFLVTKGQHLVSALLYSMPFGFALALGIGQIHWADILALDGSTFAASGIAIEGIKNMIGVGVFTIFLMGLIGTLEPGGFIEWMMIQAERFATTPTRAEVSIVAVSLVTNALTTAGTPTMVLLGPFVRRLGHKFKIAPWRRGNLLDACSTTIIGFLPYSVAVLLPYSMVSDMVSRAGVDDFTPVTLIPYVFYCWALMLTIIVAALTGWGRETMSEAEFVSESRELYGPLLTPDR
jgi:Na+/H+ antiporter NhaC